MSVCSSDVKGLKRLNAKADCLLQREEVISKGNLIIVGGGLWWQKYSSIFLFIGLGKHGLDRRRKQQVVEK